MGIDNYIYAIPYDDMVSNEITADMVSFDIFRKNVHLPWDWNTISQFCSAAGALCYNANNYDLPFVSKFYNKRKCINTWCSKAWNCSGKCCTIEKILKLMKKGCVIIVDYLMHEEFYKELYSPILFLKNMDAYWFHRGLIENLSYHNSFMHMGPHIYKKYIELYDPPDYIMEFIKIYIYDNLNWKYLSKITKLSDIIDLIQHPWRWDIISKHAKINDIKANINLPWDYDVLIDRKDITATFLLTFKDKPWNEHKFNKIVDDYFTQSIDTFETSM